MPSASQSIRLHRDLVQLLHSCQRPGETMTQLVFRLLSESSAIQALSDDEATWGIFTRIRHEYRLREALAKAEQGKD